MDDQEAVRLCAEAMGLQETRNKLDPLALWVIGGDGYEYFYDPPTIADQLLSLIEAFDIVIERDDGSKLGTLPIKSWGCTIFVKREKAKGHETYIVRNEPGLRRAIVHCVAKMQAAKGGK